MINVVYTPAYQVYLSKRCAFSCDYCNFPNVPSPLPPSPKMFRSMLRTAQRLGAWQVTLSSGEGIDRFPEIVSTARYYGFQSWFDYIYELCRLTLEAKGRQPLMPVLDIGPIPTLELRKLAPVAPLVRLMLDTVDPAVAAEVHAQAPQKSPLLRTLAINDVCRAGIPVVTGIRVGMGESPDSWIEAVEAVNEIHDRHENVMAFTIVPFVPEPFSTMESSAPVSNEIFGQAIKAVRKHLLPDIILIAEVHQRLALAPEAVVNGVFDLGPIRIADSERFDLDMLNAVNAVGELLTKINVDISCSPVIRDKFAREHRLPRPVEQNLKRFTTMDKNQCAGLDTPAAGQQSAHAGQS